MEMGRVYENKQERFRDVFRPLFLLGSMGLASVLLGRIGLCGWGYTHAALSPPKFSAHIKTSSSVIFFTAQRPVSSIRATAPNRPPEF
jgi:hypothetical protein